MEETSLLRPLTGGRTSFLMASPKFKFIENGNEYPNKVAW
jgi:hypothetical protein